jgi:hypothetical protein
MQYAYDVVAVVSGERPDEQAEHRLRLFGCQPKVVSHQDLTVFVNRERATNPRRAMAAFMRNLENAKVKFDYITVGGVETALSDYARDVLHDDIPMDPPSPKFA